MKVVRFDKLSPGRWAVRSRLEAYDGSGLLSVFCKVGELRNDVGGIFRLCPLLKGDRSSADANSWDGSWGPITLAAVSAKLALLNGPYGGER